MTDEKKDKPDDLGRDSSDHPTTWLERAVQPDIVVLGVGVIVAMIVTTVLTIHHQTEELHRTHRPQIVFTSMEIAGAITCDLAANPKTGPQIQADLSRPIVWLKNIGNADATDVFETVVPWPKLVSLKKIGNPNTDDWPAIDDSTCAEGTVPDLRFMAFPIYAGQEYKFDATTGQTIASKPALPRDAAVELVWPWCFGYRDEYGIRHTTCTTYVFQPDDNGGSEFFTCGNPITGSFKPALSGHCEN